MTLFEFLRDLPGMSVEALGGNLPKIRGPLGELIGKLDSIRQKSGGGNDVDVNDLGPLMGELGATIEILNRRI